MNSSSWKLLETSPQQIQPGVLQRNWSIRILGHWVILILVIVLSTALLPWLQLLKVRKTRLEELYVVLPVFSRDYGLDKGKAISRGQFAMTVNTTRRLLVFPFDYIPQRYGPPLPVWDPKFDTWQVRRHLSEEDPLLFVRMNVANVTYFLDLDFRGQLSWINCKWKPKDKRSTWTMLVDKLKSSQLEGPNGLFVPKDEIWCSLKWCGQLDSYGDMSSHCKTDFCHFHGSYGKNENMEGILLRDHVVLSNSSVPINHTHYRIMKMTFGCVYKRRSKATGKRMKYKKKLGSDGVLGVNYLPLSFPSQLDENNKAEHSIALCLTKTKGVSAGYITFGFPIRQLGYNVPWVFLERGEGGSYQVTLHNIQYGDEAVLYGEMRGKRHNIIMDGGLRFTYLENEIFIFFVKIVERWAKKAGYESQVIEGEEGTCWSFFRATVREAELIRGFKNITLMLGSRKPRSRLVIKPENFIISPAEGLVCLAIRSSDVINQTKISILGGMAMKEHIMLMDKSTEQLGWLEDESCNVNRLEEMRQYTKDPDPIYKCNPFTHECE